MINRHAERNRSHDAYDRRGAINTVNPKKAKALKLEESDISFNNRHDSEENEKGGVRGSIKLAKDSLRLNHRKMREKSIKKAN